MTARGLFITGTDTGVGKTVVAAAVLALLRARGLDAVPMKPVQTGARGRGSRLRAPDLDFCLARAGLLPTPADYERMAPCRLAPACSPHLAAALAGHPIRAAGLCSSFRALAARHDRVIVEGAGGVGVPLGGRTLMLDLMATLDLPVVLVSRQGLGALNHGWLTLQALRRAGLRVQGVVFNAAQPGRRGWIERDNERTLARIGRVRVLGRLPFIPRLAASSPDAFRRIAEAALAPALPWLAGAPERTR